MARTFTVPGALTLRAASDRLGIPTQTLNAWALAKHIPAFRIGSVWYIPNTVIHALETGENAVEVLGADYDYGSGSKK